MMKNNLNLIDSTASSIKSGTSHFINDAPIHVNQSTFKAGLSENVHRWFRLTPSFGPDLVREMIATLKVKEGDYILDPFSGAGTTAIESKLEGFDSLGFEINPFLQFVNRVSLNWSLKPLELEKSLRKITENYEKNRKGLTFETLEKNGYIIPPIHNPTRWWREDVLVDLLSLKKAIHSIKDVEYREFFLLAIAGVLVPDLSNVTLGRLQLHFIDRSGDEIDVLKTFSEHTQKMIEDIASLNEFSFRGDVQVLKQDSTSLNNLSDTRKVNCVITSPPYPNRYSYIWNTRPHLYFLDFFDTAKQASQVDKETIGGTWGTATSELQKGIFDPINDAVRDVVGGTVEQIRETDNLMANYAMHYFNRLTKHILELEKIAAPDIRLAYVVGNSRLKGVYIETDVLLADILERLGVGYKINQIHRFRKRNSGKDLFESIVYASKT